MCFGIAQLGIGQIAGTGHDFSDGVGLDWSWNGDGTGEEGICQPCHTPHGGDMTGAPLWSHAASTAASFNLYTSGTLNATMADPTGISLQCLGCHDGSTPLDSHSGITGSFYLVDGTHTSYVGTDLRNDHPVSFVYGSALDAGLYDPTTQDATIGTGTVENELLFGGATGTRTMECASCHDPHGAGIDNLLRVTMAGSELCLNCHNK